jgi:endonuclease YncB( thermonuclease family)
VFVLAAHGAAHAEAIAGRASVIDGDTLEVRGTRIRLHGIDAPESGQSCTVRGARTRCGQLAALALADKIGNRPVACEPRDRDRYGRVVAVCRLGGEDLNGWMVESGWALAYRQYAADYVGEEQAASSAKRGIWQGEFVAPWAWRRNESLDTPEKRLAQRPAVPQSASSSATRPRQSCDIKGNVAASGERIYHVPGGGYYDATRIDPSRGERWFCSEAEARAAGWRRSLR